MPDTLVSIVGTTTSVRDCAGMPFEKSMRGRRSGVTSSVASQFVNVMASWLAQKSDKTAASATVPYVRAVMLSATTKPPASAAVTTPIAPR